MSKITRSAEGEECQARIPHVCNGSNLTTVYHHKRGGCMGRKNPDVLGAYACSACHAAIHNPISVGYDESSMLIMEYDAMARTQLILIEKGLLKEVK